MAFHFRTVSPNTTSGAQAALMTTWQSARLLLATRKRVVRVIYTQLHCFLIAL